MLSKEINELITPPLLIRYSYGAQGNSGLHFSVVNSGITEAPGNKSTGPSFCLVWHKVVVSHIYPVCGFSLPQDPVYTHPLISLGCSYFSTVDSSTRPAPGTAFPTRNMRKIQIVNRDNTSKRLTEMAMLTNKKKDTDDNNTGKGADVRINQEHTDPDFVVVSVVRQRSL